MCGLNIENQPIDCFLIVINQFGKNFYINSDKYQLFAGACRNSIYYEDAYKKAIQHPPTKLIQEYYSCLPYLYDNIFNSFGLSLGNAEIYMIAGWFIFSFLLTYYAWYMHGFNPRLHIYPPHDDNSINMNLQPKDAHSSSSSKLQQQQQVEGELGLDDNIFDIDIVNNGHTSKNLHHSSDISSTVAQHQQQFILNSDRILISNNIHLMTTPLSQTMKEDYVSTAIGTNQNHQKIKVDSNNINDSIEKNNSSPSNKSVVAHPKRKIVQKSKIYPLVPSG